MAIPGSIYTPPNVYTQTNFEAPQEAPIAGVRLPVLIGTGNEILQQVNLEVTRGSSSQVDQQIVLEDLSGRAVLQELASGEVVLGDFDGTVRKVQVRNFPIVTGDGSGTTSNNPAQVFVEVNGEPIVVLGVDGERGILDLSVTPQLTDEVRVTYFFNREDTRVTDDVSGQVSADPATLLGEIGEPAGGYVLTDDNNVLNLRVDGTSVSALLGTGSKSAATIVTLINTAGSATSLNASLYTNNFGDTAIQLVADQDLEVLDGSANSVLGFTLGDSTARRRTFFTYQGPIVDGSNGGITTTDPGDVVVRVDNVQVVPDSVDGANRSVTLPFAPAVGSLVTVQYYFNTWQDTFDYLQNINVTEIVRAGIVPDDATFTQGVDYILKDDRILWGSAFLVTPGDHTQGFAFFDDTQITASLIDNKAYFEPATPVVDSTVSPPLENRMDFQLPFTPTTGNGRSTPLSQDLFQSITNGRIDLPTFRPDLIQAYWGWSVEDAMERGPVEVSKVDGSVITLKNPVPVGAGVWASFYYNLLQDATFTVTSTVTGGSGVGRYTLADSDGDPVHVARFGTKSAGLGSITVQFPSGSELKPDVRFEGGDQLEETATVTFAETDATLAKFTVWGSDPYYTIQDASDHARFTVDSAALAGGTTGIDVSRVNGVEGLGFPASLLGDEVVYDDDTGSLTYAIETGIDDELSVTFDGVLVTGTADANATATVQDYVDAMNTAARFTTDNGPEYYGTTRFLGNTVVTASEYDELSFSYTGDVSGPSGTLTATIAPTTYGSPSLLAAAVESAIATATAGITGLSITVSANANGQLLFKLESAAEDDVFGQSTGTITTTFAAAGAGDTITIGGATLTAVSGARTPGSDDFSIDTGVSDDDSLATEIAAAINDGANSFTTIATASVVDNVVTVLSVPTGAAGNALAFTTTVPAAYDLSGSGTLTGIPDQVGGFLEFVTHSTPAQDFAVLAGLSTDSVGGAQVKMLQTDVARRFTVAGASGRLIYDRMVLRGRLVPGAGSMTSHHVEAQAGILVEGSNGADQAGLQPQELGLAGQRGTVQPASIASAIPVSGNQVPSGTFSDLRDGQTSVTFYAAGGTQTQNNVFRVTVDGVAVTVTFADATGTAIATGGSADVPLGPATTANTILDQIRDAFTAAGLAASQVTQEGSGIRISSALSSADSEVVIGDGSANSALGFSQGTTSDRAPVEASKLASALMAHHAATPSAFYLEYQSPTSTYFASEALAGVERDETGAEFLYLQSQAAGVGGLGTSSNLTWEEPSSGNGSVLLPGTGLLTEHSDGAAGEDGISGFYVTSTDPEGSGSADTSVLNSGTGQDGRIGQTYRDDVTGLTFVVLPRDGGGNYPAGESFTFLVRKNTLTDANIPIASIPGLEVIVANTFNVPVDDTALIETFRKDGLEPRVGDQYFVTYNFTKTNFDVKFFTRTNAIEAEFGLATPDNPLSLAGSLAKTNGSLIVGFKQVLRDEGEVTASITKFATAVEELEGTLTGGASPDVLTPLPVGATVAELTGLLNQMGQHADIQSSIRFRSERTVVSGVGAGTQPGQVSTIAQTVRRERVRVFYPDIVQITFTDAFGNESQTFIDGYYVAAGWLGFLTGTDSDVATPWTAKRIVGFDRLGRNLSEVDKNTIAVTGVTVVEDRPASLRVRQGLTTDMRDILRRTPTIITIADEVQQRSRNALDRFIGLKFLTSLLIQIEGAQSEVLKGLVNEQILTAFAGVRAQTAPDNPTVAEVSAFYRPVFPLLFLVLTFGLRSST